MFLGVASIHADEFTVPPAADFSNSTLKSEVVIDNTDPLAYNYEIIAFNNKCSKPIAIFVHYLDLNNNWITDGYYRLEPNQQGNIFNTKNLIFYYYAQSMDGTVVWKGDYEFQYKDIVIPMTKVKMNITNWGTYIMKLTCDL
jgi:hypothetical protein